MYRPFRNKLHHLVRQPARGARLAHRQCLSRIYRIEQRRNDGVHELPMTVGIRMVNVRSVLISVRPFAGTVVYRSKQIDRRQIPFVNQHIHPFDIFIIVFRKIASCVIVRNDGILAVFTRLGYQQKHIVSELVEYGLFVCRLMNAFVPQ